MRVVGSYWERGVNFVFKVVVFVEGDMVVGLLKGDGSREVIKIRVDDVDG